MWFHLLARAAAADLTGVTPLPSIDPDTPDAALAPFAEVIGDAAVLGLGEGGHCGGTFLAAKARLVRWLVEHHGFRLVALESPWAGSLGLHRYVAGEPLSLAEAQHGVFWNFLDTSSLSLYRWLADWNLDHPDDPVVFIGYDVQDDPETLLRVLTRAGVSDAQVEACRAGPCAPETTDPWASLAVRSLAVRAALDDAGPGYGALRDREMADHFLRLRDLTAPGARAVVLAHDDHVGRVYAPTKRMGAYLGEQLGEGYVTIGLVGRDVRTSCIGSPTQRDRDDVERRIGAAVDASVALVDLTRPGSPFAGTLTAYGRDDALPLGEAFDALLYFDTVAPAVTSFFGDAVPGTADEVDGYGPHRLFVHDGPVSRASRDALWGQYRDWLIGRGFAPVGEPSRTSRRGWTQRFTGERADDVMTIQRARHVVGWRVTLVFEPHAAPVTGE